LFWIPHKHFFKFIILFAFRFSSSKGYSWEFKTKPSKRVDEEEEEEMDDNNYLNNQVCIILFKIF